MANNRMYLVCDCGARFYLAKYYPSTGWYWPLLSYGAVNTLEPLPEDTERAQEQYTDELNRFFEAHRHERDLLGKRFTLQYEL